VRRSLEVSVYVPGAIAELTHRPALDAVEKILRAVPGARVTRHTDRVEVTVDSATLVIERSEP
jgi:hypothetical protein